MGTRDMKAMHPTCVLLFFLALNACAVGTGEEDVVPEETPNGYDLTSPDMRPIGPKPLPVAPTWEPTRAPVRRSPIQKDRYPR